jgi:hypothetical protein
VLAFFGVPLVDRIIPLPVALKKDSSQVFGVIIAAGFKQADRFGYVQNGLPERRSVEREIGRLPMVWDGLDKRHVSTSLRAHTFLAVKCRGQRHFTLVGEVYLTITRQRQILANSSIVVKSALPRKVICR